MKTIYCSQINRLPKGNNTKAIDYLCEESNKLYNSTVYLARQLYFKTGRYANKYWLSSKMKENPHFKALYSSAAQQTCIQVGKSIQAFKSLTLSYRKNLISSKPGLPRYRTSRGKYQIIYPKCWLKKLNNDVRIPMGTYCKIWFNLPEIHIPFPTNLDWCSIKELRIVPRAGYYDAVWVYKKEIKETPNLNKDKCLSIDHGISNWLTCVSSEGSSFIVDGKHLKSLNRLYNKKISKVKKNRHGKFWCKYLDKVTTKRNNQVRDAINKAAKIVINHCIANGIGTIVFGWNKYQKKRPKLGKKKNQEFIQIPTGELKKRISCLCEELDIIFIEQEESYTSIASSIDLDDIPVYGEKPKGWKSSGKRIHRGLYQSSDGQLINADCNGAFNIGRKAQVAGMLCKPGRGFLTSPRRLRIWELPKP